MSTIRIVTDSTADLSKEEIEKFQISVIPLNISIHDEHYIDGVTITKEEFLTKMQESPTLPKSAQPAIGKFVELYDELGKDGDPIISIHLMQSLSGTVDTARQAAQISNANVTIIDSNFTSGPMGMMVLEAAKAAQEGKTLDEVVSIIEGTKNQAKLFLTVLELDNLIKGGRISRLMGAVSNLLNIKLFLEVKEGQIHIIQKGRGLKSLQKKYTEIFEDMLRIPQGIKEITITHSGLSDFNLENIERLKELFPKVPMRIEITSPIIMTHTGTGAMALSYIINS